MKYWVSFSAFQVFEYISDITLAFILPFYIELKLTFLCWLVLGTKLIFDSIVNRELTKREKAIDKWLNRIGKARNELVAIIWFEVSRCSIKIFTALMSGGLSAIVKTPEQSNTPIDEVCCTDSGEEEEEEKEAIPVEPVEEKKRKRKLAIGAFDKDGDYNMNY